MQYHLSLLALLSSAVGLVAGTPAPGASPALVERGLPQSYGALTTIPTYVHVVVAAKEDFSNIPRSLVQNQMTQLNNFFADKSFRFDTKYIKYYVNATWAATEPYPDISDEIFQEFLSLTPEEQETFEFPPSELFYMEQALKNPTDRYDDLNIYILADGPLPLTGDATTPQKLDGVLRQTSFQVQTGVTLAAGTMAPGIPGVKKFPKFNMGKQLVKMVAFWLGAPTLYGLEDCDYDSDNIDDTPIVAGLITGCPKVAPDSCPNLPGKDPIHNYLTDADDICLKEVTPGQQSAMRAGYRTRQTTANQLKARAAANQRRDLTRRDAPKSLTKKQACMSCGFQKMLVSETKGKVRC